MIGMIGHPKVRLDDLGHPVAGPQVGGESRDFGALQQQSDQVLFLGGQKFRGTSRGFPGLERLFSPFPEGGMPSPDASAIHADPLRDVLGGKAFLKKNDRPLSAAFQVLGRTGRSHGHYLHLPA